MKYTVSVTITQEFEFTPGSVFLPNHDEFLQFIQCLEENYEVSATTCMLFRWDSFPSHTQGGTNTVDVVKIEFLTEEFGKIAVAVWWKGSKHSSLVILKKKTSKNTVR